MLSENDKKRLFNGKRCAIYLFFRKKKILKGLNSLIRNADEILKTYPVVTFDNVYETALLQQNSRLLYEEQMWSQAADNYLLKMFNCNSSDIRMEFDRIIPPDTISQYAKTRTRLELRRNLLIEFRNELEF